MTRHILGPADAVPEGQARGYAVAGLDRPVFVVRRQGRLVAYLDACPHYASPTPMAWRKDAYLSGDGRHIACHAHGALFEIDSGRCVRGPCLGKSLTGFEIRVTADNQLEIALPAPAGATGGRPETC